MQVDWGAIEEKWRSRWREERQFEACAGDASSPKMFITVAYPYPNSPQHVGHGRTYTVTDVHARFCRMRGYNVLFPIGFHYTGTPILGMAKRVEEKDPDILEGLREIYQVPQEAIDTFTDPVRIADYFHEEIRAGMIEMGYSIDWRREFTTIDPAYQRFIEWHITLLREKGLIVQGSHPVGWCPQDKNPVSQHDTLGDVEPEFTEYVLVRFRWNGHIIPTATLRPETIFGVTNLWANPGVMYRRVKVDGERWIISSECARKLEYQDMKVEDEGGVCGSELAGGTASAEYDGREVPILEAGFVDPGIGTGLVMSVPAHAPFDYQALADIQKSVPPDSGPGRIRPVAIIETDGYGEIPAREAVEGSGITDQEDPRLEEISAEVYSKEFYGGTLLGGTGRFAGMKVSEAKEAIREWLTGEGHARMMLELAGEVRCRCGARCVVKIFSDQWFLNYADAKWKEIGTRCLDGMEILPPEIRGEFHNVIGWLRERACARQRGLGTKLPWDPDWTVESLADSVVYMAYYIVARFVREGRLDGRNLPPSFFDYVFLGKGSPDAIPGVAADTAREARAEFAYFYPVDSRHSGRDLVPNHLTFFALNHAVTFPREHWPRQIVVNGSVLRDGKKMSKSMGNIVPLRQAIREYGADPIRLTIIISAELLQDAEFSFDSVSGITHKLESMIAECSRLGGAAPAAVPEETAAEDGWILGRLQGLISGVTASVERMRLREALHDVLFSFESDLAWYLKRIRAKGRDSECSAILHRIHGTRVQMLSPFAPHAAEEMWEMLGMQGTASRSAWPEAADELVSRRAAMTEHTLQSIVDDIASILKVTGIEPKRITVYAAGPFKTEAYRTVLGMVVAGRTSMGEIMKELASNPATADIRRNPDFVKRTIKDTLSQPEEIRRIRLEHTGIDEREIFESELAVLAEAEFGAPVSVYTEGEEGIHDPRDRARHARPFKPALLVE